MFKQQTKTLQKDMYLVFTMQNTLQFMRWATECFVNLWLRSLGQTDTAQTSSNINIFSLSVSVTLLHQTAEIVYFSSIEESSSNLDPRNRLQGGEI